MANEEIWTTRPDIAARVLIQQGDAIMQMYHAGKLTEVEAGNMFIALYQQDGLGKETKDVENNGGILPLTGQTSTLLMLGWRMAPTEEPKP